MTVKQQKLIDELKKATIEEDQRQLMLKKVNSEIITNINKLNLSDTLQILESDKILDIIYDYFNLKYDVNFTFAKYCYDKPEDKYSIPITKLVLNMLSYTDENKFKTAIKKSKYSILNKDYINIKGNEIDINIGDECYIQKYNITDNVIKYIKKYIITLKNNNSNSYNQKIFCIFKKNAIKEEICARNSTQGDKLREYLTDIHNTVIKYNILISNKLTKYYNISTTNDIMAHFYSDCIRDIDKIDEELRQRMEYYEYFRIKIPQRLFDSKMFHTINFIYNNYIRYGYMYYKNIGIQEDEIDFLTKEEFTDYLESRFKIIKFENKKQIFAHLHFIELCCDNKSLTIDEVSSDDNETDSETFLPQPPIIDEPYVETDEDTVRRKKIGLLTNFNGELYSKESSSSEEELHEQEIINIRSDRQKLIVKNNAFRKHYKYICKYNNINNNQYKTIEEVAIKSSNSIISISDDPIWKKKSLDNVFNIMLKQDNNKYFCKVINFYKKYIYNNVEKDIDNIDDFHKNKFNIVLDFINDILEINIIKTDKDRIHIKNTIKRKFIQSKDFIIITKTILRTRNFPIFNNISEMAINYIKDCQQPHDREFIIFTNEKFEQFLLGIKSQETKNLRQYLYMVDEKLPNILNNINNLYLSIIDIPRILDFEEFCDNYKITNTKITLDEWENRINNKKYKILNCEEMNSFYIKNGYTGITSEQMYLLLKDRYGNGFNIFKNGSNSILDKFYKIELDDDSESE